MKKQKYNNNNQKSIRKSNKGKIALATIGLTTVALGATYGVFHQQINAGVSSVFDRLRNPSTKVEQQEKIDNQNLLIDSLKNDIAVKDEEIRNAVAQIESLTTTKSTLESDLQVKSNLLAEKETALANLQSEYDTKTAEYTTKKAELEAELESLGGQNTELETQLQTLQDEYDNKTSEYETEKTSLNTQILTLTSEKSTLQQQYDELSNSVDSLQNQITTLENEKTTITNTYNELMGKYTSVAYTNNTTNKRDVLVTYTPLRATNTQLATLLKNDNDIFTISDDSAYTDIGNYTATCIDMDGLYDNPTETSNYVFNIPMSTISNIPDIIKLTSSKEYVSGVEGTGISMLTIDGSAFATLTKPLVLDLSELYALDIELINIDKCPYSFISVILPDITQYGDRIETIPSWYNCGSTLCNQFATYNIENVFLNYDNSSDDLNNRQWGYVNKDLIYSDNEFYIKSGTWKFARGYTTPAWKQYANIDMSSSTNTKTFNYQIYFKYGIEFNELRTFANHIIDNLIQTSLTDSTNHGLAYMNEKNDKNLITSNFYLKETINFIFA